MVTINKFVAVKHLLLCSVLVAAPVVTAEETVDRGATVDTDSEESIDRVVEKQGTTDESTETLSEGQLTVADAIDDETVAGNTDGGGTGASVTQSDIVIDYLDAIEQVEMDRGAYSQELADLYLGLANALLHELKLGEAKTAFQRGMQIERINHGLNAVSQEPFLYSLADIESLMGNWKGSHQAMENIYQINSKTFGETDQRMLPVLDRMMEWYLGNYEYRDPLGGYSHLILSEHIANEISEIHKTGLSLSHPDAVQSFRKIGYVHYFIAQHLDKHGGPGKESGFTISYAGEGPGQLETYSIDRHYRRGKEALQLAIQVLDSEGEVNPEALASAVAELGDWYLVFGKKQSAMKSYQVAHQILEDAEDDGSLYETYFDQPRVIDFTLGLGAASYNGKPIVADKYVDVTVDITREGMARRMNMENVPDNLSKKSLRTLRSNLKKIRFRPRMVDGQMEKSEDFVLQYPVKVEEEQS